MMRLVRYLILSWLLIVLPAQAGESISLTSDSGDTLMLHRLNNGEIWGSLIITDQVADSFADHELIVMQLDQHKPIKLDQQKHCGTPAGEVQKVAYEFSASDETQQWKFSQISAAKTNVLKLKVWDQHSFDHMRSDRRPEVVDFPLQASLAIDGLWQKFIQGKTLTFRYMTDADESRQAIFKLESQRELIKLL